MRCSNSNGGQKGNDGDNELHIADIEQDTKVDWRPRSGFGEVKERGRLIMRYVGVEKCGSITPQEGLRFNI